MRGAAEASDIVVLPECVEPFQLFRRLGTQWRQQQITTVSSVRLVRTGLDYVAAALVSKTLGFDFDTEFLDKLQIMEAEALKVFAEQAAS